MSDDDMTPYYTPGRWPLHEGKCADDGHPPHWLSLTFAQCHCRSFVYWLHERQLTTEAPDA